MSRHIDETESKRQSAERPRQLPLPEPPAPVVIRRWRCLNCGQQIFTAPDEAPPEVCAYCQDMTTWRQVE